MNRKKIIVYGIVILIVGIIIGVTYNKSLKSADNSENIELGSGEHEEMVQGYFFKTTKKDVIEKEFDGEYLNSFVTVAEPHDEYFIKVKGIAEGTNVYMINPTNGDMTSMEYKDGTFSIKVPLEKGINYGIIMDYKLVGSIRVVDDLGKIEEDKLFRDILVGLGCGL